MNYITGIMFLFLFPPYGLAIIVEENERVASLPR